MVKRKSEIGESLNVHIHAFLDLVTLIAYQRPEWLMVSPYSQEAKRHYGIKVFVGLKCRDKFAQWSMFYGYEIY